MSSSLDMNRIYRHFLYSKMSKVSFLDTLQDICLLPLDESDSLLSKAIYKDSMKDAEMLTCRSTILIFPFEILHCQRQWFYLIEIRLANLQVKIIIFKSLSHPTQTTEVEMKISHLCASNMFLTQQPASHPLPCGLRDNLLPTAWNVFCHFCKLAKKKKKDYKHLALWGKRLWRKFSHIFLSLHKFSVLHSCRVVWEFQLKFGFFTGLGIQARLPTFIWLLALVHYRPNVSVKHSFKYYTFPIWWLTFWREKPIVYAYLFSSHSTCKVSTYPLLVFNKVSWLFCTQWFKQYAISPNSILGLILTEVDLITPYGIWENWGSATSRASSMTNCLIWGTGSSVLSGHLVFLSKS